MEDVEALRQVALVRSQRLQSVQTELAVLRQRFFQELVNVGRAVGVALPEPEEIELLDVGNDTRIVDWLTGLAAQALPDKAQRAAYSQALEVCCQAGEASWARQLVRRVQRDATPLAILSQTSHAAAAASLVRRSSGDATPLTILSQASHAAAAASLVRRSAGNAQPLAGLRTPKPAHSANVVRHLPTPAALAALTKPNSLPVLTES